MLPAPSSARRVALLGCVLLATSALLLSGCGQEGTGSPDRVKADSSGAEGKGEAGAEVRSAGAGGCPRPVDGLVKSLDALREQLAIGLSYEQYAAAIGDLRASYARIPVDRLALDCLAATGTPAEQALNEYIDGANTWGECLADAFCTTAEVEPVLQRKWRVASRFLSEAD